MNPASLLFRQVHPNFLAAAGKLTSQAFMPFPKDHGGLSVYDGEQISANESFRHYTETLKRASKGVWGVNNEEVTATDLSSRSDPLPDFPAHALIDFSDKSVNEQRKLAKKLARYAEARGCLYANTSIDS
ncbi:MAG: hypothetical protein LBU45_04820 [Azoarcus sp.]|jgi:hypothetical protein|nr:hypothetical protein [Azoarcus sp.]